MTTLFGRQWLLTIGALQIEGHDMTFEITKSLQPEPNTAAMTVYNIDPDSRKVFERGRTKQDKKPKPLPVTLQVGYRESATVPSLISKSLTTIFDGEVTEVLSMRDGADIVTELRTSEGGSAVRNSRTNRSFKGKVEVKQALEALAKDMGIGLGNMKKELENVGLEQSSKEWLKGTTLSGATADLFSKLIKSAGKEWSIQNGKLQILDRKKALSGLEILVDPDSGLIGVPTVDSNGLLKATMLIIPDIVPGRKLRVKTDDVDGLYRATRCVYRGDTSGNDWYIDIEADIPK